MNKTAEGEIVFHAATRGNRWEVIGYADGTFKEFKHGRATGSGGRYSQNGLARRLAAIIQDGKVIDGINYQIDLDRIGVKQLLSLIDADKPVPSEFLRVSAELVKIAKQLTASDSLVDLVIDQRELSELWGYVDEQTYDLLIEVYQKLQSDFALSSNQREAINRLTQSKNAQKRWQPDMHRNNIFKAAHALGIKLPSSMF